MPYVDEGEPKPRGPMPPLIAFAAAFAAAVLGAALWSVCFHWFKMAYPAGFLAGLGIGLAIKLTLKTQFPPIRITAIVLTVVASMVGYIWVDQYIAVNWNPPMPRTYGESLERFFKDITAILFTGIGAYIAFVLALPKMPAMQPPPA